MTDYQIPEMFITHLTWDNFLMVATLYLIISLARSYIIVPRYPVNLAWEGYGSSWFAGTFNLLGSFAKSDEWVHSGYNKYNKKKKPFVLPSAFGNTPEIVLPRDQLQWMLDYPDDVLSVAAARNQLLNGRYSFISRRILDDPYHEHVIHKTLSRNLNVIIPDLNDEVCRDVDEMFGTDPSVEYKSHNIFNTLLKVIPKITNRMLVGEPLCRNETYLHHMLGFTESVIRCMLVGPFIPSFLQPLIMSIVGYASNYHYWRSSKYTLPLIEKRKYDIRQKDAGDPAYQNWKEPQDFITWSIRVAVAENRMDEYATDRIAMRICPLNFASIHTTSLTAHSALLDILSADPNVLESLREEASRVYAECGNTWSKTSLSKLVRLDSAIRESMRFSAISQTFIQRMVVAEEGITTPDGTFCAKGTIFSGALKPILFDPDLIERPETYDAFRYSRPKELWEKLNEKDKAERANEVLGMKQTGMVTTSDSHFAFGHGRHACPGRFFVAHELKIMFAYLFLNYDIKHLDKRPQGFWVGRQNVPPTGASIELKRREKPYSHITSA